MVIYDYDPREWFWTTGNPADVGSYTLQSLLTGMVYGRSYYWLVSVFRGADSFGYSFYMNGVKFQSSGAAAPAGDLSQLPSPVGDLSRPPAPPRARRQEATSRLERRLQAAMAFVSGLADRESIQH